MKGKKIHPIVTTRSTCVCVYIILFTIVFNILPESLSTDETVLPYSSPK